MEGGFGRRYVSYSSCVYVAIVPGVVAVSPVIQLLAGAGASNLRRQVKDQDEDDTLASRRGKKFDVALWLPPKQIDHQNAQVRQVHGRPIGEGGLSSPVSNQIKTSLYQLRAGMLKSVSLAIAVVAAFFPSTLGTQHNGGSRRKRRS